MKDKLMIPFEIPKYCDDCMFVGDYGECYWTGYPLSPDECMEHIEKYISTRGEKG